MDTQVPGTVPSSSEFIEKFKNFNDMFYYKGKGFSVKIPGKISTNPLQKSNSIERDFLIKRPKNYQLTLCKYQIQLEGIFWSKDPKIISNPFANIKFNYENTMPNYKAKT
jgi:hypothetical protein